MKYTFTIIFLLTITATYSQDVITKLDEASASYTADDLENTRFALQQSLNELDVLIGKEILKMLPSDLAGNSYDEKMDNVVGSSAGFTGVFVNRTYPGESKTVRVELVNDSPLLTALSGYLTNPLLAGLAGSNQKVVKIDSYKARLQKDENDPMRYEVQIPIDQSLFSIKYEGFESESEVTGIANQIGIREIAQMLK